MIFLEGNQIFEGVDASQVAGVDQAHEDIADQGAELRLEKQRVFPVQACPFQCLLADVMPTIMDSKSQSLYSVLSYTWMPKKQAARGEFAASALGMAV
jgi:hypothetical protein